MGACVHACIDSVVSVSGMAAFGLHIVHRRRRVATTTTTAAAVATTTTTQQFLSHALEVVGLQAAVATVPVATAVVVAGVTDPVSRPGFVLAVPVAVACRRVVRVQATASVAIGQVVGVPVAVAVLHVVVAAAVPAVPVASAVVVSVVTDAVAHPFLIATCRGARRHEEEIRAFAVQTSCEMGATVAAIARVPVTTAIVVAIVAKPTTTK